jgi:glycerophosphoryl diester phosphodiesterase
VRRQPRCSASPCLEARSPRSRRLPTARTTAAARAFDIQAHRGGLGLRSESALNSFGNARRLGVTTVELDIQITEDGQAVVTHDRRIAGTKCLDTAPAAPGDPEYPYVGRYINTLTLAQVRTLDCGSLRLAGFPNQVLAPGTKMPLLVKAAGASTVLSNWQCRQ